MTNALQIVTPIAAAIGALALLGLLVYWQLVIAEGAYLGDRVVTYLYDRFASRYDDVKAFNPFSDATLLAAPILAHAPDGRVLDIATGTGRLPCALFAQPKFTGRVGALDASAAMLAVARHKLAPYADRIDWHHRPAVPLPFNDGSYDVVTCLEAMEFISDPAAALREMRRVLRPGGLLLISNRIGPDAWKLPGRAVSTAAFLERLGAFGFAQASAQDWLVDYDLITAFKPPA